MQSVDDAIGRAVSWTREEYCRNPLLFLTAALGIVMSVAFLVILLATHGQSLYGMLCNDRFFYYDYFYSVATSSDHPYTVAHVIYPPLVTTMYAVISWFTVPFVANYGMPELIYELRDSQMGIMSYFMFILICVFLFVVIVKHISKNRRYAAILCFLFLLSYPMIYAIDRGNVILLVLPLCLLFVLGYRSEHKAIRYLSYLALAITVGIKIYPIFLGALVLRERNPRDIAVCITLCIIMFFVPFVFTDGSPSILIDNLLIHIGSYTEGPEGFTLIHQVLNMMLAHSIPDIAILILGYVLTAMLFLPILAIILFDKNTKDWQLLILVISMMFFGPAVAVIQYMLVLLAIPLIFFLREERERTRRNIVFVVLFVICLAPIPGLLGATDGLLVSQNVVVLIKCICIVVLMLWTILSCMIHLWNGRRKDTEPESVTEPCSEP